MSGKISLHNLAVGNYYRIPSFHSFRQDYLGYTFFLQLICIPNNIYLIEPEKIKEGPD